VSRLGVKIRAAPRASGCPHRFAEGDRRARAWSTADHGL